MEKTTESPLPRLTSGFTLIELMMTIAVLAILASLALPSMQSVIESNRLTTQANTLLTAFQFARSEAVRLNGEVRICAGSVDDPANDEAQCSGSWSDGWLVFDTGVVSPRASRVWPALGGDSAISSNENIITFFGNGSVDPSDVGSDGVLTIGLATSKCVSGKRRELTLTRSGAMSVESVKCT